MKEELITMVKHHSETINQHRNKVNTELSKLGYSITTPEIPSTLFVDMVEKENFTDQQIMLITQLLVNAFQSGNIFGMYNENIENEAYIEYNN